MEVLKLLTLISFAIFLVIVPENIGSSPKQTLLKRLLRQQITNDVKVSANEAAKILAVRRTLTNTELVSHALNINTTPLKILAYFRFEQFSGSSTNSPTGLL